MHIPIPLTVIFLFLFITASDAQVLLNQQFKSPRSHEHRREDKDDDAKEQDSQENDDEHKKEGGKDGKRRFGGHHRHYYGQTVPMYYRTVILPTGFSPLQINGQTYYYNHGSFYKLENQNLFPVGAPVGAKVDQLPTTRAYEKVGDVGYNIYNGVYYRMTPEGWYEVVLPPNLAESKDGGLVIDDAQGAFVINVPKRNGEGYEVVVLTRTDDGFRGPQGELYEDLPPWAQLIEMYGN